MPKERSSTIIERFGFKDIDLITPEHDAYMLWLFKEENRLKLLVDLKLVEEQTLIHLSRFDYDEHKKCDWDWNNGCTCSCNPPKLLSEFTRARPTEKQQRDWFEREKQQTIINNDKISKENEQKVKDLLNQYLEFRKNLKTEKLHSIVKLDMEYAILGYNNYNIGFVDAILSFQAQEFFIKEEGCHFFATSGRIVNGSNPFVIEVKPKINSLGELVRQINMYRSHLEANTWIILTETSSFDDVLKQQNILTYHPKF